MLNKRSIRWLSGLAGAFALCGGFVVSGLAGTPAFGTVQSGLAPEVVITGTDVLYTVSFPYLGKQTLVKGEIRITFPADWSFAPPNDPNTAPPASPNVCAPATSPDPATKLLSCIRGTIRPGDPIVQEVRFRTGAVADGKTVSSLLTFDEGGSDQDTGRSDIIRTPLPDASVDVVLTDDDRRAGKCGDPDGYEMSTKQGISETNKMTTKMILPANPDSTAICSPAFARELPVGSIDACPDTVVCTTEIAITGAPQFQKPITLIFDIFGKPKDFYKTGLDGVPTLVPPCTRTNPPDPCLSNKGNIKDGTRWTINWSGNDPSWTGG
jgi:hypothetical protein